MCSCIESAQQPAELHLFKKKKGEEEEGNKDKNLSLSVIHETQIYLANCSLEVRACW